LWASSAATTLPQRTVSFPCGRVKLSASLPLLYPISGAFVKGSEGISPKITPIIPHLWGVCQGGSLNAPTHRYYPPILHILYPDLKRGGAPPVESLLQFAQQEARQRGNFHTRRFLPSTQPTHANASSRPTTKRATMAKPPDAGTPLINSCASGSNATNNTATKDYTTNPEPPNASPRKPTPT